jgi:hypothetical protein
MWRFCHSRAVPSTGRRGRLERSCPATVEGREGTGLKVKKMDNSVKQARWLLAPVWVMCGLVAAIGFIAG